ncbi:MAG: hypothetical protein GY875_22420 [Gammaproteobacteria bacterium]|nr:hypothetical protein [Gammaproteobacteria bacterium]
MNEEKDRHGASTDKLHRAYHAKDSRETAEVYDDWAAEYEEHMKNVGYTHPAVVASMVARHVAASDERALDAGAGTDTGNLWLAPDDRPLRGCGRGSAR